MRLYLTPGGIITGVLCSKAREDYSNDFSHPAWCAARSIFVRAMQFNWCPIETNFREIRLGCAKHDAVRRDRLGLRSRTVHFGFHHCARFYTHEFLRTRADTTRYWYFGIRTAPMLFPRADDSCRRFLSSAAKPRDNIARSTFKVLTLPLDKRLMFILQNAHSQHIDWLFGQ